MKSFMLKLFCFMLIVSTTLFIGTACKNEDGSNNDNAVSQGLEFESSFDKTGYAVAGLGECFDTTIIIPSTYKSKPVVEIKKEAFIGENLTSVTIPNSVTSIGDYAFNNCDNLTNITVDGNNTAYKSIDGVLYSKDGKTLICYPAGKTATVFTIPNSVTSIGEDAFYKCTKITSLVIPKSVISICEGAFLSCANLTAIYYTGDKDDWDKIQIVKSNTNLQNATRYYYVENKNCKPNVCGKYWYYNGEQIEIWNFHNYESSITLPTCVEQGYTTYTCHCGDSYIDNYVNALGHTEVIDYAVAPTCTETGLTEGKHCSECNEIFVKQEVVETTNHNYADYFCSMCGVEYCSEGLLFEAYSSSTPNQLIVSGYNGNDTVVYIPQFIDEKVVVGVGSKAFYNSSITSITLPETIETLFTYAFSNCKNLKSILLPNSLKSINAYAFENCKSLESIVICKNVNYIGQAAFSDCDSLTKVNFTGTIDDWVSIEFNYAMYGNFDTNPIYKSKSLYINDVLQTDITITAEKINSYAFCGCNSLKTVKITNNVKSIGHDAFHMCNSLNFNVAVNIKYLGNEKNLYYAAISPIDKNIEVATINEKCEVIASEAFYSCNYLHTVNIGRNVKCIGTGAFAYCSALNKTNYKGVIDEWALIKFENGSANPISYSKKLYINNILQTDIEINSKAIKDYAFAYCESLNSIIIGKSVTSIGGRAFDECVNLSNVIIGNNVTRIGNYAFYNCSNLESIELPFSVKNIGYRAFKECANLNSVILSDYTNWKRAQTEMEIECMMGYKLSLTSPEITANYLKNTYANYYWYKL